MFPEPPERYPVLAPGSIRTPVVLSRTATVFGLVDIKAESVGSAHVFVDGVDFGEEPVLVRVLFAGGAPLTRVEIDIPGQGRVPVDLRARAVPWELRVFTRP